MTRPITLITGASAGLGVEFARQCAARGDALVLVARREDRLEALKQRLGGDVTVMAADLAKPGAPEDLLARVATAGLHVATLINNAGFGHWRPFTEQPAERQREMIDLNVAALTTLTRLVLPDMVARRQGNILNVASIAGMMAGPGSAVYSATKAYVLSLTEALHQELKGSGVHVTALCPGPVRTEFAEVAGISGAAFDRMALEPAAVVRAALKALASNKARVVPGAFPKFTSASARLLPRGMLRRAVSRVKMSGE